MAAHFFDSNALVKRFARETGTNWIFKLLKPSTSNIIYIARITGVEVVAAITRRTRAGSLTINNSNKALARFERSLLHWYAFVEIREPRISQARLLARKYGLRGYDAVQLAAALDVHNRRQVLGLSALTLVSADNELNNAALAENLLVENPNNYP